MSYEPKIDDKNKIEIQDKIKIESYHPQQTSATKPTMTTIQQQKDSLMTEIKALRNSLTYPHHWDNMEEMMAFESKISKMLSDWWALERPELCGQICSLCGEEFNGWGNNPAPLKAKGQCCDDCNATKVIPARAGCMSDDEEYESEEEEEEEEYHGYVFEEGTVSHNTECSCGKWMINDGRGDYYCDCGDAPKKIYPTKNKK